MEYKDETPGRAGAEPDTGKGPAADGMSAAAAAAEKDEAAGGTEKESWKRGTILLGIGGFYTAAEETGEQWILRAKKKFRREGITPLPGDRILFSPGEGEEQGWIEEILPRTSLCLRPPAANVETLVIVTAPVPEPDLRLADRMLARAFGQGMKAVIAVNKIDLDPSLEGRIREEYGPAGVPVYGVRADRGDGVETLREALRGSLCCLAGQSGAGKSTLLNAMTGLRTETGEISRKIRRGKNTTRRAELILAGDLRIMDTAGFSLLEPEKDLRPEDFRDRYPEFRKYEGKCRFRECLHDREPGCAVARAAETGEIHPARWERYRELLEEIREGWRNRYD